MKNIFLLFHVLITLFCTGCSTNSKDQSAPEQIIVRLKERKITKLSWLSNHIRYIELDPKALLGEIAILKASQNRIYVYDDKGKQLVCFSAENGKRIFTIDKYGRGPGEILGITSFCINRYLQCIEVMDWGNLKILRFDMNGQFISEQKYSFPGHYFEALDSASYVVFTNYLPNRSSDNQYFNLLFTNRNYQIVKEQLPFDPRLNNLSFCYPTRMLPYGKDWLLSLPFSYDIYKISSKGVDTLYTIYFPGHEMDRDAFDMLKNWDEANTKDAKYACLQTQSKFFDQLNNSNVCFFIENFYESDRIIGFQFSCQKKAHLFLHSKKNKKDMVISKLLYDDGSNFNGKFHYFDDNKLFASVEDRDREEFKIMIMDLSEF